MKRNSILTTVTWVLVLMFPLILALSAAALTLPPITTEPIASQAQTIETTVPETTVPTELIPSLAEPLRTDLVYIADLSKEENVAYRIEITNYITELFSLLADLDITAWDYLEVSNEITEKITTLQDLDTQYLNDYLAIEAAEQEQAKWDVRWAEYPVATQVWLYLKNEMGYSDHAAAGIIGNMMAECGGHTLDLKWGAYNPSKHYGLCQWSSRYYPEMQGATLEEQLEFMKESFPEVIDRYGYLYTKGFDYEQFITMDDCGDAAIAFCVIYERPGGSQNYRRGLAQKAYDYFVG